MEVFHKYNFMRFSSLSLQQRFLELQHTWQIPYYNLLYPESLISMQWHIQTSQIKGHHFEILLQKVYHL